MIGILFCRPILQPLGIVPHIVKESQLFWRFDCKTTVFVPATRHLHPFNELPTQISTTANV